MLLLHLIDLLFENPFYFAIVFIMLTLPLLISITIHEWAHGYTAYKFGDPTPQIQGRLSLNPFKHLDPLGTIMLFIAGIGWAKPIIINPENIKSRFKIMLVALAGPASNFIFAIIFSIIGYLLITLPQMLHYKFSGSLESLFAVFGVLLVNKVIFHIVQVNLMLGIFNLIPLPPLDGANIIRNLIPEGLSEIYFRIAPYGYPILLVLILTGGISFISNFADQVHVFIYKAVSMFFDPIFKSVITKTVNI